MKKNNYQFHVHFSEEIRYIRIPNRSELPCMQQYYAEYKICQKQFIEQNYILQHGTLAGFNFTTALQLHNKMESLLEKELFPEDDESDDERDERYDKK